MDDYYDLLKWQRQAEALSNPIRELQKQQDLLRDPFRDIRENQKLFALATGAAGCGSVFDLVRQKSLAEQHVDGVRSVLNQLALTGFASTASDSIAALMVGKNHQLALQAQMKELMGPVTVASAMAGAFSRSGFDDAIRGNLSSITSTIAALQDQFSIGAIAKRMSLDAAMMEAAHAYLSEEEGLASEESEVTGAAKKVVKTLNENTVKRLEDMSWFEVLGALYFLIGLLVQYHADLENEIHRETAEKTLEVVEENADQIERLERLAAESAETIDAMTVRAVEYERIAALSRAIAPAGANVRVEPMGSAKRMAVLDHGQQCAVEETSARWIKCTYLDALTEEPRTGWIWKGSLELID